MIVGEVNRPLSLGVCDRLALVGTRTAENPNDDSLLRAGWTEFRRAIFLAHRLFAAIHHTLHQRCRNRHKETVRQENGSPELRPASAK